MCCRFFVCFFLILFCHAIVFSLFLSFGLLLHFAKHHKQSNSTNNILRPFLNCFYSWRCRMQCLCIGARRGCSCSCECELSLRAIWIIAFGEILYFLHFLACENVTFAKHFFLHKNNNTKSTVLIVVLFVNAIVFVQKYIWFSVFDSFEGNECFCLLIYSFV